MNNEPTHLRAKKSILPAGILKFQDEMTEEQNDRLLFAKTNP